MLNLLKQYETDYAHDRYGGKIEENVYLFENRNSKVILSAPHTVRTFRNHKEKAPDLYTGALVRLLGQQNGLSTITRRKFTKEKNSITDFIVLQKLEHHCFLDIHGMKENSEFDLAVGTGILTENQYNDWIEQIEILAKKYQIRFVINHPSYTGKFGLTGDLQRIDSNPRILQLEWQPQMRDFYSFSENVCQKTIPFIRDLALYIQHDETS